MQPQLSLTKGIIFETLYGINNKLYGINNKLTGNNNNYLRLAQQKQCFLLLAEPYILTETKFDKSTIKTLQHCFVQSAVRFCLVNTRNQLIIYCDTRRPGVSCGLFSQTVVPCHWPCPPNQFSHHFLFSFTLPVPVITIISDTNKLLL